MRRLLSAPLTYLVLGEALVLVALGIAGWQLLPHPRVPSTAQAGTQPAAPEAQPDPVETIEPAPLPTVPVSRPHPSPTAGAGSATTPSFTDPAYWTGRLGHLNSDQAQLQQMQWNVIQAVEAAAEGYLRDVVLTAVARAQRSHPVPSPQPAASEKAERISSESVG